jgi:CRP-like cAMP-binding protein
MIFKEIITHLIICLQSSYNLSRGLAHDRVDVRIAATLTSLALKFSRPLGPNKLPTINFTRQQLADLTGTTSETAIRVTRAMQRNGLIDIKRPGIIKILDLVALQELSDS